tara:strand:+ start:885 stop:1952 length:1068 start_codon:yes stop_codon:yes gene_type:complete
VKKEYLCLYLATLLACRVGLAADASADPEWSPGETVPVCAAPADQQSAAITSSDNGLLVVWQDNRPVGKKPDTEYPWSVYGRYLKQAKEFPIHLPPDADAVSPDVSGNHVVWVHNRGWSSLEMMTLQDGSPTVRKPIGSGLNPAIDGNLIVWSTGDNRFEEGRPDISWIHDIKAYELDGPGIAFDVTNSDKLPESVPAVSGSTVVWEEATFGSSGWSSTFLRYRDIDRDGSGRRVAGTRDKKCVNAAIDNRFVVWQDDRNGGWDIYGFDIVSGRERSIHKGPGDQENPALHGSLVVWQDNRNGDWDIYGYDIRTRKTFPLFVGVGNQTEPDIYGDVVVWTDDRGDDKDIYATRVK